tara:strand:- start:170 stop:541 length:372 start_codon:yes stop_codon:yes gene_type:complete
MEIEAKSMLGILCKKVIALGLVPRFAFTDNVIFLESVNGKKDILGFLNGMEPGEGRLPLHEIFPKLGDKLSLVYVEQGVYNGNFFEMKENSLGVEVIILDYEVMKEDLILEEEASQILCVNFA